MIQRLHPLSSDRGSVLVMVAVWMTSAVALMTFVIDVGHWFEHRRHLQLQMDAGALAGGGNFNGCFGASAASKSDPNSAANLQVENAARKYAGDTLHIASAFNPQVNNQSNVTVVLNSTDYPNQGGTDFSDPAGPPCTAAYIDLKSTDAGVPWFLAKQIVPGINAHARVSIQQVSSLSGALPLAVRDVNPLDVGAIFIDEGNANAVLGRQDLTAGAAQPLNGVNVVGWTGGPLSVAVPNATTKIGVVIALCSNAANCGPSKGTAWLTSGSVAAVCSELYVQCWNNGSTGLDFVQGYSTTGTGTSTAPIVRSVTLTKGTCSDDSSPYFLLNAGCNLGVQAQLDFGITTNPSLPPAQGGLSATATVGGCTLSYVSSSGTTSSWSASSCLSIASGAGQSAQTLNWSTGTGKIKVSGSFANVARPFANDGAAGSYFNATGSYPVAYLQVSQGASCASGLGNSVPYGTSTNLCVGVGILGNLKAAANAADPTQILKFIGSNGSHSGAIDCGNGNLRNDIINGCNFPVKLNTGAACPDATHPQTVMAQGPSGCAKINTGQTVGQARQGMDARFTPNGICDPNNWSQYPNIPSGDPRVVPMIVTLSDAFGGSGSGWVPVTDFAAFYVTGWDSQSNACSGVNEAAPPGAGNGTIWGHFIMYVGDLGNSTGGSACTFTAGLTPCIPVLTQ
jgi:hypothetical protein